MITTKDGKIVVKVPLSSRVAKKEKTTIPKGTANNNFNYYNIMTNSAYRRKKFQDQLSHYNYKPSISISFKKNIGNPNQTPPTISIKTTKACTEKN